ncbi:hypothetical protein ACJJTC_009881 [Scirpophaga incertulas]
MNIFHPLLIDGRLSIKRLYVGRQADADQGKAHTRISKRLTVTEEVTTHPTRQQRRNATAGRRRMERARVSSAPRPARRPRNSPLSRLLRATNFCYPLQSCMHYNPLFFSLRRIIFGGGYTFLYSRGIVILNPCYNLLLE